MDIGNGSSSNIVGKTTFLCVLNENKQNLKTKFLRIFSWEFFQNVSKL